MQNTLARLKIIRIVLSVALVLGMVITYKLWLTSGRFFPHTPVFSFLPQIPFPLDLIVFGAIIVMLLLIAYGYWVRRLMIVFCISFFILLLLDQNRWQPWAFQYFCMMCVIAFIDDKKPDVIKENNILNALRLVIGGIYLYSGLQKLNPQFFLDTYPWLLEPLTPHVSEGANAFLLKLGYVFPAVEIFMGLGLFFRRTRKTAIIFSFIMHTLILIDMSPLGHNYNHVIWPWNIAMMVFVMILFKEPVPIKNYKKSLKYRPVFLIFLLFWIMPFFSFFNLWDSYLSASLYSGNTSSGVLYFSNEVKEKLPKEIHEYINKAPHDQYQLNIKYWSMYEMGVPGYPERRMFNNVKRHFYRYANDSLDMFLLYKERASLLSPQESEVIR